MTLKKILIVDDDEDDVFITRALFEEIGPQKFMLDWAPSYEEGELMLRENRHDLCLMDYRLGAHDGIELLARARDVHFSGPIILLTGVQNDEVDNKALQAGAVDFLVKEELTAPLLARAIRYALGRKEVEAERLERLRAETQNRAKSKFLAHLSHELRSPLSAILGFTELLISNSDDSDTTEKLRIIDRNGKHLLGLLNDVLDLSKIEADRLALDCQKVNLTAFLSDIYSLVYSQAVDKNLEFMIRSNNLLPVQITTDATRLRQVLLNLINNAIKFTDSGEILVTVQVVNINGKSSLEFSVRDTGIGISRDNLDKIFLPFVRSGLDKENRRAGTGLGLSICKQLVFYLGGDIRIESVVGEGSEFFFSIDPGDITGVDRQPFELDLDLGDGRSLSIPSLSGKVLIVDDLRDIRQLIGHFAEAAGLQVSYAKNGLEAQQAVARHMEDTDGGFDAVLMDIHMPVMGGVEAVKKLREMLYRKPVIALTAAHMRGDHSNFLAAGFDDYLSKPVERHALYSCIKKHLVDRSQQKLVEKESDEVVLIVDDNRDTLSATSALIEMLGHQALTATGIRDATDIASKHTVSLALIDLDLGEESGYDLCTCLARISPDTVLVILSGSDVEPSKLHEFGVECSALKPVDLETLNKLLCLCKK